MFTPEEVEAQLAAIEQAQNDKTTDDFDEEDPFRESPAEAAERVRRFNLIKELLTATNLAVKHGLGTS